MSGKFQLDNSLKLFTYAYESHLHFFAYSIDKYFHDRIILYIKQKHRVLTVIQYNVLYTVLQISYLLMLIFHQLDIMGD